MSSALVSSRAAARRPRGALDLGRWLATVAVGLALAACGSRPPRVVVAAASDLSNALPELGAAFVAQGGADVAPTFAASKVLATQLLQGAPFDLFMSADSALVDGVVEKGRCDGATKALYARGHLVLWVKGDARPPETLADLADVRWRRIAIANPDTAPYGAAARAALQKAGLWERVAPRLVRAESLRQALQTAESGNAEVALVSTSLALGTKGAWRPVDDALYPAIEQSLVVCHPPGRALAAYILGPEGQAILARWGLAR